MRSVKGMTIGSPEFVAVVKAAEREGEVAELIEEIETKLRRIGVIMRHGDGFTREQVRNLRWVCREISEGIGE